MGFWCFSLLVGSRGMCRVLVLLLLSDTWMRVRNRSAGRCSPTDHAGCVLSALLSPGRLGRARALSLFLGLCCEGSCGSTLDKHWTPEVLSGLHSTASVSMQSHCRAGLLLLGSVQSALGGCSMECAVCWALGEMWEGKGRADAPFTKLNV